MIKNRENVKIKFAEMFKIHLLKQELNIIFPTCFGVKGILISSW